MATSPITPDTRSAKAEQRVMPLDVQRMMGLERAADLLGGKPQLAEALCISVRAVRYKLTADRGIGSSDLRQAAAALEDHAAKCTRLALRLRALQKGAQ